MKVLCFKIFGDFAHFKPGYTTTSPITYSIIPLTSAMGILGAILGLNKDKYYSILMNSNTKIGIGVDCNIRKKAFGINLINTKGDYWVPTNKNSNGPRTPIKFEFLVNPKYIMFIAMDNEILLNDLYKRVKEHKHAYTLYFGLADLIADTEFVDFVEVDAVDNKDKEYIEIDTAVSIDDLVGENKIDIFSNVTYMKERHVKSFSDNRIPYEFVDVLFSHNNERMRVKLKKYYKFNNYKFTFINER
ncbi:MAG: type I-B CRISPR-associated protein Cas5b [Bacilli bacterium]